MKKFSWLLILFLFIGCETRNTAPGIEETAPLLLLGQYQDDYGIAYTIEEDVWHQHPDTKYRIVHWFPEAQYLVAQNDSSNPSDGGLWTRIDWLELTDMPPYKWAFCLSAYNASSAEEAAKVDIAQRETPLTGCNGYPFSRMQPKP